MILYSRKSSKPKRLNVDESIVEVRETLEMEGASTITVDINDPDWSITNADFFDLDEDGKLDHVEAQYGSNWFRLAKVSPNNSALSLQMEHRIVSILRRYHKPKHHRRVPGYTRAMFIKALVDEARNDGHSIKFYAPHLHAQQAIAKGEPVSNPTDTTGRRGFPSTADLTVKGTRATKKQRKIAADALNVAHEHLADSGAGIRWRVNVALMEALITESTIHNYEGGDADSGGVLQVRRSVHPSVNVRNVEQVVTLFLTKGFSGRGGAITLAGTTTQRPHEIAQSVQGSAFSDGSNYKANQGEAEEWVKAFHLITGADDLSQNTTVDRAYYFGRGYDSGGGVIKGEDSWDAMNRLAYEVNDRVFVRGNTIYYVTDDDIYKQKPELELSRLSPRVIDFSFDWDEGKPVNEASLTIQRLDIPQGVTIEMADAGPASVRWLVWQVEREKSGGFSTLQLRTPQKAKPEPAPQRESITVEGDPSGKVTDAFDAMLRAMKAVDRKTPGYTYGGGHGPSLDSLPASTRFDCSSSVSWVLHKAGLFPHSTAWVSGDFAAKFGKPGKGKLFTVWANADHVWIQLHKSQYWRFDTGGPRVTRVQQHGGGPDAGAIVIEEGSGAHLSTESRSTGGFTARHYEGM